MDSNTGEKNTRWVEVASGTLERNERKERDGQPDYKGKLLLSTTDEFLKEISKGGDDIKVYISGWQKEGSKDGKDYKFVSLSVSYPFDGDSKSEQKVVGAQDDLSI